MTGEEEEDKKVHREFFFLCLFSIRHEFCNLVYTCSVFFCFASYSRICSFYVIIIGEGAHLKY